MRDIKLLLLRLLINLRQFTLVTRSKTLDLIQEEALIVLQDSSFFSLATLVVLFLLLVIDWVVRYFLIGHVDCHIELIAPRVTRSTRSMLPECPFHRTARLRRNLCSNLRRKHIGPLLSLECRRVEDLRELRLRHDSVGEVS